MITNNLSTLKIHKLSQEQYNREFAAGTLDANALYLTPDEEENENGGEVSLEALKNLPNLHTWKKYNGNPNAFEEISKTNQEIAWSIEDPNYGRSSYSVKYSNTISVKDGVITLDDPQTLTVLGSSTNANDFNTLRGKYIYGGTIITKNFFYIPEDATFTINNLKVFVNKANLITLSESVNITEESFVSAENRDAYPTSGQHTDGYWYEYYKVFGSSGIYVGSGEMPEGYFIQIDPNEDYENEKPEEEVNGSGKTLIGELELNSTNITAGATTGIYNLGTDLQAIMTDIFTTLDNGYGALVVEMSMSDLKFVATCNYCSGSTSLNAIQNIQWITVNQAATGKCSHFAVCKTTLNTDNTEMLDGIIAGYVTSNVKFYTISGGSGSSSGDTSVVEEELPEVTYQDNGKVLMVVDGKWAIGPINNNTVLPGAEGASF